MIEIERYYDSWRQRAWHTEAEGLREPVGGRTKRWENPLRMVASHPSTSANPVERQNARRRHPLNNEALGFYACLTSPRERSFSVAIGEREIHEFVATVSGCLLETLSAFYRWYRERLSGLWRQILIALEPFWNARWNSSLPSRSLHLVNQNARSLWVA